MVSLPLYLKIVRYLRIISIIDLIRTIISNNTGLDWVVTAVRKWLNHSANTSWLLVYDNVDNFETPKSLIFFQILFRICHFD